MAGLGNLSGLLGKVKEIQANMQQMQEGLADRTVEAGSGGGMVTATVNGKGELLGLKIEKEVVDVNDIEMLEELVKAAVNAALAKNQEITKQEMAKLTGGLNIPGLEHLFSPAG